MKTSSLQRFMLLGLLALLPGNALAQQSGPHDNETVLKTSIPRGFFSVFINNEKVGDFQGLSATILDVSSYAHRGANLLHITWRPLENKIPIGQFHIAFAAKRNQFSELATVTINQSKVGMRTLSFTIPVIPRPIGTSPSHSTTMPTHSLPPRPYKQRDDRIHLPTPSGTERQRPAAQRHGPSIINSIPD